MLNTTSWMQVEKPQFLGTPHVVSETFKNNMTVKRKISKHIDIDT